MAPRLKFAPSGRFFSSTYKAFLIAAVFWPGAAHAKDPLITAIELFDGPSGAAYVQATEILINGRTEVRGCNSSSKIDKDTYGKLPKIPLTGATQLERTPEGILVLTRNSETTCVVPSNLKFEKDWENSASALADHAVLQGRVLSSSPPGVTTVPALKPGVKLVFVNEANTELAEYLRADRARNISGWEDFLRRYPDSRYSGTAKQALSALHEKEAEARFEAYRKSVSSSSVSYDDLEKAWQRDQMALDLAANDAAALHLKDAILAELGNLTDKGQAELHAYEQALSAQRPGYMHLATARQFAARVVGISPHFQPAQSLSTKTGNETAAVEASIKKAESLASSQNLDEALAAVAKYRCFAPEEPRIADILQAYYQYHVGRARTLEGEQKWREAAEEYDKAAEIKKSPELVNSANRDRAAHKAAQDKILADAAVQRSMEYETDKNYIDAYEILAVLPDSQRALVADRMVSLEEAYIKSAVQEAKRLEDAHTPLKGKRDEMEVQRAYEYLKRVNTLEDNRDLKVRLDLLSQTLSDYYVQQAKRYLEKPLGSGIGVAWIYLDKAQQYRANRDDIRDERTKNASLHDMRSTLSVGVSFQDQTSQRDSTGFAALLSDAIATGLGTSELPITIVRSGEELSPNFKLIGDVIQHRVTSVPTIEAMQSKYRAGMRDVPNEDWNRANRDYEAAKVDLESAQRVLEGAQARGKKNEIAAATERVSLAKKRVLEAGQKLDSIPRTLQSDVIRPYTYVKKTYNLSAVVELASRIEDAGQRTVYAIPPINKSASKTVVVLENVKGEDTEGVRPQGTPPDESQLLRDVENEARDALIKEVATKVQELPLKILARARQDLTNGDLDGAAESYILYLNSTPGEETKERIEAKRFLQDQFNISQDQFSTSKVANSGS